MSIILQILVHICVIQLVSARYKLLVEIHSFVNPDGRCPDMGCLECCEGGCPATICHYFFSICQRPPGTNVSFVPSLGQGNCVVNTSNAVGSNPNDPHLFDDSVYGLDNPIMYSGEVWSSEGSQIHLELIDDDPNGDEELIDRFIVNATLPVGTSDTQTYSGIFGFAELNLTLTLQCAEDFYDADCNRFCLMNCECGPGLTGPFCAESIDDCENITCGENMMCEDGHLSFNCVCEPGYTDLNCTTDIDECAEVNCTFGICQQGRGFFTCMCPPGYSGHFCEEELDSFEVTITIEAVINHEGRCADRDCTSRGGCCDRTCPRQRCEYYLRYCLRPIDTPVSYEPAPFKEGECTAINSLTESRATIFEFTYRTLTLSGRVWDPEGIQIYIELIDKDFSILYEDEDDLIDRFVINVTSLMTTRGLYGGIFGMADLAITAEPTCHQEFSGGQLCDISTTQLTSKTPTTTPPTQLTSETLTAPITVLVLSAVVLVTITTITVLCICVCVLGRKQKRLAFALRKHSLEEYATLGDVPGNQANESTGSSQNPLFTSSSQFNRDHTYTYPALELQQHSINNKPTEEFGYRLNDCPAYHTSNDVSPNEIDDNEGVVVTEQNLEANAVILTPCPAYLPKSDHDTNHLAQLETMTEGSLKCDEEYDHGMPYWVPADRKTELLSQFRKLRIPNISQNELNIKALLGRGAFGEVYKGVWQRVVIGCEEPVEEEVAVKTMEDTSKEEDRIKFLQEAVIMAQFSHLNIVKIKAVLILDDVYKIVMELMAKGDLKKHLPKQKSRIPDVSSQLLYYSRQVASGVSYLSSKGYIHRDLAARNVLVSHNDICKIGDFGLSRDLQKEEYYKAQEGGKIPLKWTAPEALHYYHYSTASDVWSFGCVLYEIWSLGADPYSNLTNIEALKKIPSSYFLPPPPGCPRAIYDIMIKCWNQDATLRPGSDKICTLLNLPEYKVLKWSDEDIARYSEEARTVGAPLAAGEVLFKELQYSS